jgi:hypothetical protein
MEKLVPDVWDQIVARTRAQMSIEASSADEQVMPDSVMCAAVPEPHIAPNNDLIDPTGWLASRRR